MATWRVRITGGMRKAVDYDLLLAAILALGRQFHDEQRRNEFEADRTTTPEPQPPETNEEVSP